MNPVLACAACYGDPQNPMSKGAILGVIVLGAIIVSVLGGFGGLFLYWRRRAIALDVQLAAVTALVEGMRFAAGVQTVHVAPPSATSRVHDSWYGKDSHPR